VSANNQAVGDLIVDAKDEEAVSVPGVRSKGEEIAAGLDSFLPFQLFLCSSVGFVVAALTYDAACVPEPLRAHIAKAYLAEPLQYDCARQSFCLIRVDFCIIIQYL
jgi:hypothetical protein